MKTESEYILYFGLLFAEELQYSIDESTEILTFQHRLLQEFTAAYYICQQVIHEPDEGSAFLKRVIPDWDCITKQGIEVILFICNLLKKSEKSAVMVDHVGNCIAEHLNQKLESGESLIKSCSPTAISDESKHVRLIGILQEEVGLPKLNKNFSIYPECGHLLKDVLAESQMALFNGVITDQNAALVDLGPFPDNVNAKVIITNVTVKFCNQLMKMVESHRDCIQAILLNRLSVNFSPGLQLSSLPCSLRHLELVQCFINEKWSCEQLGIALKDMVHLTRLNLRHNDMRQHGVHIAKALEAMASKSKIQHLNLSLNYFPIDMSSVLLSTLTKHTQLRELDLSVNTLEGCVPSLMQSPPPSLSMLDLNTCELNADDIRSISFALQQGKLLQIESLNVKGNGLSESDAAVQPLLQVPRMKLHIKQLSNVSDKFDELVNWDGDAVSQFETLS